MCTQWYYTSHTTSFFVMYQSINVVCLRREQLQTHTVDDASQNSIMVSK